MPYPTSTHRMMPLLLQFKSLLNNLSYTPHGKQCTSTLPLAPNLSSMSNPPITPRVMSHCNSFLKAALASKISTIVESLFSCVPQSFLRLLGRDNIPNSQPDPSHFHSYSQQGSIIIHGHPPFEVD